MNKYLFTGLALLASLTAGAEAAYRLLGVGQGLPDRHVQQIIELPNGQILTSNEGVFSLFNGREFRMLPCNLDSIRPLSRFGSHCHLWQGDTLLWLKDFYSLYLFDARRRCFVYDYDRHMTAEAKSFAEADGGQQTAEQTGRLAPQRELFSRIIRDTPLAGDWLHSYCRDRQGGQWFGTGVNGIVYLPPQKQLIRRIDLHNGDIARQITEVDSRHLLVGGNSGLYLFNRQEEKIVKTLAAGNIHCADMAKDASGRIWISTQQGLYLYENGDVTIFDTGNTTGLLHNHMRFALSTDTQRVLICNLIHNLGYLDPQSRHVQLFTKDHASLQRYRTMVAAQPLSNAPHKVAVCSQNGFFILDTKTDSVSLSAPVERLARFSRKYNCMLQDRQGRLWLGTQSGLIVSDGKEAVRLTADNGLSHTCIQGLVQDRTGHIWVGTSHGINRITPQADGTFRIRQIGYSEGLPDVEITERGVCQTGDGTIYWATPLGMMELSTAQVPFAEESEPVVLVGCNVAGQDRPLDAEAIVMSYKQNYLRLDFSALNYAAPSYTHYRHRLNGLKDEWNYTYNSGDLLTLHYYALPPGHYSIEVQAAVNDGPWGTAFRKEIIVSPPLWLTWWAKLFYAFCLLLLISGSLFLYLRRKRKKMEQENNERVNQLFELREEARHKFVQSVNIDADKISINKEEELLMERILGAIDRHMDDSDYTVDMLAQDTAMSRASLYRRMQTMLGITPNDFMRHVRLKRAAQLLLESDLPVNQISLQVGFQTPRYFSQCFKNVFGVSPREYRDGKERTSRQVP